MIFLSVCLYLLIHVSLSVAINCKDEAGRDVDWFIAYKIPKNRQQVSPINTGFAYAYLMGKPVSKNSNREEITEWKLSKKQTDDEKSIFGQTLGPLYDDFNSPKQKYTHILYSDQPPEEKGWLINYP